MFELLKLASLRRPTHRRIHDFLASQKESKPNFDAKRRSQRIEVQRVEAEIADGREFWELARNLIRQWRVFETPEGIPYPPSSPPQIGQIPVNLLRTFGIWFLTACQITEVVDQRNHYGFTFETLPGHVETGWETFQVRYDTATNKIVYLIESESAHRFWLMSLGSPVVHWLQRRHKRNSVSRIRELMQKMGAQK